MAMIDYPAPYPSDKCTHICPFTLHCREIDDYALLIRSADDFAYVAAADEQLLPSDAAPHVLALMQAVEPNMRRAVYWEKNSRRFRDEGGCPAHVGHINGGSVSSVVCALAPVQLHEYCELKFCEKGRKVYCPIWRERRGKCLRPK